MRVGIHLAPVTLGYTTPTCSQDLDDDVREHLEATMAAVEAHRERVLATSGRCVRMGVEGGACMWVLAG